MAQTRTRKIVFTWNNFPEDYEDSLRNLVEEEKWDYIGYALETAPTTHKKHIQGFATRDNARSFKSIVKDIPGWHVEIMKGDITQNKDYCSKEGNFKEIGKKTKQGKRTDLDEIRDEVLGGKKVQTLLEEGRIGNYQQLKFAEGLLNYRKKYKGPREVTTIYGGPGVGKTKMAVETFGEDNYDEISFDDAGRMIGYSGHENVIINDFRCNIDITLFLRITDRYPITVNTKGSTMAWSAKNIIITTNKHPKDWYGDTNENIGQIIRRHTKIIYIDRENNINFLPIDTEVK